MQAYVQADESTWDPIQVILSLTLTPQDVNLGETLELSSASTKNTLLSQASRVSAHGVSTIEQSDTSTTLRYEAEASRSSDVTIVAASEEEVELKAKNKDVKLRYFCDQAAAFVSRMLTPDTNRSVSPDGLLFGAGTPTSKHNTRAFNLDIAANDPDKWSDPGYQLVRVSPPALAPWPSIPITSAGRAPAGCAPLAVR